MELLFFADVSVLCYIINKWGGGSGGWWWWWQWWKPTHSNLHQH